MSFTEGFTQDFQGFERRAVSAAEKLADVRPSFGFRFSPRARRGFLKCKFKVAASSAAVQISSLSSHGGVHVT